MATTLTIQGVEYSFDEGDISNREAMAIERTTGVTFGEFGKLLEQGSMLGLTALVWTVQRRTNPTLKFGDVDFKLGDVDVVTTDDAPADPGEPASAESA